MIRIHYISKCLFLIKGKKIKKRMLFLEKKKSIYQENPCARPIINGLQLHDRQ